MKSEYKNKIHTLYRLVPVCEVDSDSQGSDRLYRQYGVCTKIFKSTKDLQAFKSTNEFADSIWYENFNEVQSIAVDYNKKNFEALARHMGKEVIYLV